MQFVYKRFGAHDFRSFVRQAFQAKAGDNGYIQLFRYLFVGGVSVIADAGSLIFLTSYCHVYYLLSAVVGFVMGTIVNYLLSVLWVFESSGKLKTEVMLFTLIGAGGLGLNELLLWLLVSKLGVFYVVAKAVSVSIVLLWSFTLRKLLFRKLTAAKAALPEQSADFIV